MAVDRDIGDGTDFVECVAWDRAAEFLTDSFYQRYPMANSEYAYSKSITKIKELSTKKA